MACINEYQDLRQKDSFGRVVEQAKTGDTAAFQRLYGFYVRRLLSFAHRMLNNRTEAEEVVQEAFILVFRKIGTLKENDKFESWVFRVTRNLIYLRYRRRPSQLVSLETDEELKEELEALEEPQASPEEKLLAMEKHKAARRAILSLPEKMREAFLLSVFQNFPYQQIAEITGKSVAAVKSDIHRARMLVREHIRSY